MKLAEYRRVSFMPNPPTILAMPSDIEKIPGHWVPVRDGERERLETVALAAALVDCAEDLLYSAKVKGFSDSCGTLAADIKEWLHVKAQKTEQAADTLAVALVLANEVGSAIDMAAELLGEVEG